MERISSVSIASIFTPSAVESAVKSDDGSVSDDGVSDDGACDDGVCEDGVCEDGVCDDDVDDTQTHAPYSVSC